MAESEWKPGMYVWGGSSPHNRAGEMIYPGDLFVPSPEELRSFADLLYSREQWESAISDFDAEMRVDKRRAQTEAAREVEARPGKRAPEDRPEDAQERSAQVERMRQRESDKQIRARFRG